MKKISLFIFFALPVVAYSQYAIPANVRSQFALDKLSSTSLSPMQNTIYGLPAPPGRVIGDTYLDSKWNVGTVLVSDKNSLIEGYPMKYDVKAQNVEIKTSTGIRLLDVKNVGHMIWLDSITRQPRYFVNAARYREDDVPLIGVLEVLVDGKKSLFEKTVIHTKSPNYNVALDAGSRDAEIYKKSAFYYNDGQNLIQIKSKKKLIESLTDIGDELEKYIKSNRLDVKDERDLVSIFTFYNSKTAGSN